MSKVKKVFKILIQFNIVLFLIIQILIFSIILIIATEQCSTTKRTPKKINWQEDGLREIQEALNVRQNQNLANNIILFIGDGMDPNTVTATRIHKFGEEGTLSWERFPNTGTLKVRS